MAIMAIMAIIMAIDGLVKSLDEMPIKNRDFVSPGQLDINL